MWNGMRNANCKLFIIVISIISIALIEKFSLFSAIPSQGNRAELTLTVLHRNNFGLDEFLGQVTLPLNQMDQFERPRSRWFKLMSKAGQEKKDKDRGELEIRTAFTVKAGSLSDLSKKDKNKSSLSNIAGGVGGSLLSLGAIEKRKSLKKFAKSLGSKMHVTGKKKKDKGENDSDSYTGSFSSLGTPSLGIKQRNSSFRNEGNADPGVISEDEDEFAFDNLSHKSSGSSLNVVRHHSKNNNNLVLTKGDDISQSSRSSATLPPIKPKRNMNETTLTKEAKVDEWEAKLYGKSHEIGSTDSLKRRSWDRVPLNTEQHDIVREREATIEEQSMEKISLEPTPVTAPASPSMDKPLPLPRAATAAEPIVSMHTNDNIYDDGFIMKPNMSPTSIKSEKQEKESIFSKKWKNFKKELTPNKNERSDEMIKNQYNRTSNINNISNSNATTIERNNERIIIGGDAFHNQPYIEKSVVSLPKEVLAKYDGKSKEVIYLSLKLAHDKVFNVGFTFRK